MHTSITAFQHCLSSHVGPRPANSGSKVRRSLVDTSVRIRGWEVHTAHIVPTLQPCYLSLFSNLSFLLLIQVVFRSTSAMVYIFIQMSCEMWDFDIYGESLSYMFIIVFRCLCHSIRISFLTMFSLFVICIHMRIRSRNVLVYTGFVKSVFCLMNRRPLLWKGSQWLPVRSLYQVEGEKRCIILLLTLVDVTIMMICHF